MLAEIKERGKFRYEWLCQLIRDHLKVSDAEFNYLIRNKVYKSKNDAETRNLFRRLVRRKLIKKHHRGIYYPSDKLYEIKNLLLYIGYRF